ncbi:MAG: LysM peptidoglycan-binding domain-containing protein [Deltaproteobacteria bacterium]|jgi:LysM repeat protein
MRDALYKPIEKKTSADKSLPELNDLSSHKLSRFYFFLAYSPVLIAFLAVGFLLWHFQVTVEKDLSAVKASLYSIADVLDRMDNRINNLQRLAVESKASTAVLERELNRLSGQITVLDSGFNPGPKTSSERLLDRDSALLKEKPSQQVYHEVKSGDTLYRIAKNYGVSVRQVVRTNNLSDKDRIYPGQRIVIIREAR